MNNKLQFFSTANSLNSILSLDVLSPEDLEKKDESSSDSIFSIAQELDLKQLFVVEKNPSSFPVLFRQTQKDNIQLAYGLKLQVCQNMAEKTVESITTEHSIIIFAKNGDGYRELSQIYSLAATNGLYRYPRLDLDLLKTRWSDNLSIVIPFYDSFLWNNSFLFNACIMDEFFKAQAYFSIEDHDLPYDNFWAENIREYIKENGLNIDNILDSHTVYYKNEEDFKSYLVYRSIQNRSSFDMPNLEGFSSSKFCIKQQ